MNCSYAIRDHDQTFVRPLLFVHSTFLCIVLKLQFEYDISVSNMSYGFVNFNYIVCDSFIAQAEIPPFAFKHFWSAYL